ncbi:MAG: GNAT family N-acetyltransferase [Candidatus Kariarchaeaceae archaeon]|jgi:ribosomal-protein-alanine N-acetyltransferase
MSLHVFPKDFPKLETERLILRAITPEDRVPMFNNYSDVNVAKWFFENPLTSVDQVDRVLNHFIDYFKQGKGLTWAIILKENNEYIGTVGYETVEVNSKGEIGFDLAKAYWRKGIMSEAIIAIIQYGFTNLGLSTINSHTYSANIPARNLLEKLGFKVDQVKKDAHHYKLTINDWIK